MPSLSMPTMHGLTRPVRGLKSLNPLSKRDAHKSTFEICDIVVSRQPPDTIDDATGLIVQIARGSKISTTKQVALEPGSTSTSFGAQRLGFVATLFKTSKGFSDKPYRLTILAVNAKRPKPVASVDIDLSEYVDAHEPRVITKQCISRSRAGHRLSVQLSICSRAVASGDDDVSDCQSTITALSSIVEDYEVDSSEAPSGPLGLEQDLRGFDLRSTVSTEDPALVETEEPSWLQAAQVRLAAQGTRAELPPPVFKRVAPRCEAPPSPVHTLLSDAATALIVEGNEEGYSPGGTSSSGYDPLWAQLPLAAKRAPAPYSPGGTSSCGYDAFVPFNVEEAATAGDMALAAVAGMHPCAPLTAEGHPAESRAESSTKRRARAKEAGAAAMAAVAAAAAALEAHVVGESEGVENAQSAERLEPALSFDQRVGEPPAPPWPSTASVPAAQTDDADELREVRNELAMAREELRRVRADALGVNARAARAEAELESLRAAASRGVAAATTDDAASLAPQLIEAKLAAAQFAFERDEAKAKAKGLRDQLEHVLGGGKRVARHATKIEVRYEELRRQHDANLKELMEAQAKLKEKESWSTGDAKCPACGYARNAVW